MAQLQATTMNCSTKLMPNLQIEEELLQGAKDDIISPTPQISKVPVFQWV